MIEIAGTLLFTPEGKVVLHRRDEKAPTSPNLLGLFGGHAEEDETPEATARRELAEEISLDVTRLTLQQIGKFLLIQDGQEVQFTTYRTIVPTTEFEVYEGVGAEIYSIEEALARQDLTRSTRITITRSQEIA